MKCNGTDPVPFWDGENMKKAAVMYDFDKTLCDRDMQEYSLIPNLGYENAKDFWKEVGVLSSAGRMDGISAYLYMLKKKFEEAGHPLKRSDFNGLGQSINLYPGVAEWFGLINEYGAKLGLEVEHYIISSGMEEIIADSPIAKEMKKIYACRYYYDENGLAQWPAQIVNYTTKTQYIFRINKQVLDETNDSDLNTWVPMEKRPIPFTRMIYVADGLTDVPCMKLVKANGGKSIAVYNPASAAAGFAAAKLINENRADFIAPADYTKGEKMYRLVTCMLDEMSAAAKLEDYERVI